MNDQMRLLLLLALSLGLGFSMPAQSICEGSLGGNLLSGDFGTGQSEFLMVNPFYADDLDFVSTYPTDVNTYAIGLSTSSSPAGLCWSDITDNSSAENGYMLIANIATVGSSVFTRSFEVCDGIQYHVSFDAVNLEECAGDNIPELSVFLDGVEIINTGSQLINNSWQTYSTFIEIPGGVDYSTLEVRCINSGAFAIDNVSIRHCGPTITLPAMVELCPDAYATITPVVDNGNYPMPYFQWQQSYDGGASWIDMQGENAANLNIGTVQQGILYRVQMANGVVNFMSEPCRVTSNPTTLNPATPVEIYLTPTVCEGDTFYYQGQSFSEEGSYTLALPGDSGCDSLIHLQLFTFPTYQHLYSLNLCEGELYNNQAYYGDTTITQLYSTVNGCDSIVQVEIEVSGSEDLYIIGDDVICGDNSATLNAPPAYVSYLWSTGSDQASLAINTGGLYELTVTNSAGCELSTSLEVMESAPTFLAASNPVTCQDAENGQIALNAVSGGMSPYMYRIDGEAWQDGLTFQDLGPGIYSVAVQDAWGCEYEESIKVSIEELPELSIAGLPNQVTDYGDTLYLAVVSDRLDYQYRWEADGLISCDTCSEITWESFYLGQLSLWASAPDGCNQRLDVSLDLRDRYRVFIPSAFSPNGDSNNDTFYPVLGSNARKVISFNVYDRWGGEVYANPGLPDSDLPGWDGVYKGEAMDSGTYLYDAQIEFNNGKTRRFAGIVHLMR